jgi:hypothetical protein
MLNLHVTLQTGLQSSRHAQMSPNNGRHVLHAHPVSDFDLAPGKKVCPEKVAVIFRAFHLFRG